MKNVSQAGATPDHTRRLIIRWPKRYDARLWLMLHIDRLFLLFGEERLSVRILLLVKA